MNDIEKAIKTLEARKKFVADINLDAHVAYNLAIQALEIQQDLKVYLEWLRNFEKWETIAFYEVADRIEDFILD